jgi:hypothetical protein
MGRGKKKSLDKFRGAAGLAAPGSEKRITENTEEKREHREGACGED